MLIVSIAPVTDVAFCVKGLDTLLDLDLGLGSVDEPRTHKQHSEQSQPWVSAFSASFNVFNLFNDASRNDKGKFELGNYGKYF